MNYDPEQKPNITRVNVAIAAAVKTFCRDILSSCVPPTFFMSELTQSVTLAHTVAPDSPGRILRDLRKRGEVDYKIVSRAMSLYEVVSVK